MHSNGAPRSGVDIASGLITAPCLDCGDIVALASLSKEATKYASQNNDLEKKQKLFLTWLGHCRDDNLRLPVASLL